MRSKGTLTASAGDVVGMVAGKDGLVPAGSSGASEGVSLPPEASVEASAVVRIGIVVEQCWTAVASRAFKRLFQKIKTHYKCF